MKIKALAPWFGSGSQSRVHKDATTGCWEWQLCRNNKGYGVVGIRGTRIHFAHRLSFMVHVGPIPAGLCVLHRCDNPPCCNPEHLFLGDRASNNADMVAKRRHRKGGTKTVKSLCRYERGSEHHAAKFTEKIVREIREQYAAGGCSYGSLARRHGVKPDAIGKLVRRERWVHI